VEVHDLTAARDQGSEDSRTGILAAAAQCFLERGFEAASIDEVARRIGATKGRIYHHFPSKTDLLAEVFRVGMEMNFTAIEPVRSQPGPAVERWIALARAHVRQMMMTRPFQRAVWQGVEMHLQGATTPAQRSTFNTLLEIRESYGAIFRQTIEQARAEGDMRFSDAGIVNQVMFLTLNSPIFWYSPRSSETEGDRNAIVGQIVAYALGGLGGNVEKLHG
jgi:AcrR family transcriptional regulator